MRRTWSFGALLLAAAGAALAVTYAGETFRRLEVMVPAGDPVAGRAAFVALSCASCHRVVGDEALPAPVSANPGPVLRERAWERPSEEASHLASSIVAPSHLVGSEADAAAHGRLSPMGDFSEALTVRQLVDLVAYLQAKEQAAR